MVRLVSPRGGPQDAEDSRRRRPGVRKERKVSGVEVDGGEERLYVRGEGEEKVVDRR